MAGDREYIQLILNRYRTVGEYNMVGLGFNGKGNSALIEPVYNK